MTHAPLPELQTAAIRDSVAATLRKALLAGHFSPGEDLSEVVLASELGVSRGPVREALLILALEGLLTHEHNRGFSVLELKHKDLSEIQIVRLPLERLALELARPRVSKADFSLLEDLVEKLVEAFHASDYGAMADCELRFHSAISKMSGVDWLDIALKRVIVPFFTFIRSFWSQSPNLTESLIRAQHRAYIDYLRGDNSRSAEECACFHLSLYDLDAVP